MRTHNADSFREDFAEARSIDAPERAKRIRHQLGLCVRFEQLVNVNYDILHFGIIDGDIDLWHGIFPRILSI